MYRMQNNILEILWQWLIHYINIILDIFHCLMYSLFDIHDVSEIGNIPIFRLLIVIMPTDFYCL
jgi:hypothetical protein